MKCRCKDCGKTFKNEIAFESHACVTNYAHMSLEELMKVYKEQAQKKS